MGHFSHTCKLSGLPITGGTPVALFPLKPNFNLYENSEKSLKTCGTTYQCSNDGTRLKFSPRMLPIFGIYDSYGGIEDIVKDENTKILEEYFELTIEEICSVLTSNRKDDGYDDSLKCIKDASKPDEYESPNYLERYKELVSYSGMWVHGDLYRKLTDESFVGDNWGDNLDLGVPLLLEAYGFKEISKDKTEERYKRRFQKDDLIIHSDGTWVNIPNEHVYRVKELKTYCEKHGTTIDESHLNKSLIEQLYDYVLPQFDISDYSHMNLIRTFKYKFLEYSDYSSKVNPFTAAYLKAAKKGLLKDDIIRFNTFDSYMYAMGRYYAPVGTAPQDGDYLGVDKVLKIANNIIDENIKEWRGEEDE